MRKLTVLAVIALSGLVLVGVLEPRTSGQILYCVMTVLGFVFTWQYASGSNWRATAPGRALLWLICMFSTLSAWVSLSFWVSHEDTKAVVRGVLVIAMCLGLTNMLISLRRIQRSRREERDVVHALLNAQENNHQDD